MKIVKSSILILSVIFLFFGSIGVDVFSHLCQESRIAVSYSSASDDHCGDHEVAKTKSCCEDEHESDCCEDEYYHIQLKLDFVNGVDVSPVIIAEISTEPVLIQNELPLDVASVESHNSLPPPKSGKEHILEKQNWLI